MKNTAKSSKPAADKFAKKAYTKPKLKSLGSVRSLTLKTGSATDGFGSFV